jgi:beta-lactamase superfamily II metal-dependent hydrolase
MIRIDLMPAQSGDCLWIEYGDPQHPYRVLVDGGTPFTYGTLKQRIESLPKRDRTFELLVITHIDADHIGGILKLLKNPPLGLEIGDVWFNGLRHLPASDKTLSVQQAEEVTEELANGRFPWNAKFKGAPIFMTTSGPLPRFRLRDGIFLTLLSPYHAQLRKLLPKWEREVEKIERRKEEAIRRHKSKTLSMPPDVASLAKTPFESDIAEANGSSLALIAEYEGKRILLGADAFSGVLERSIRRFLATTSEERLRLDAFKISHHGSKANTSTELLRLIDCENYLISTDGSIHGHPDVGAVARILTHGGEVKTIHFNYRSPQALVWDNCDLKRHHRFETRYPAHQAAGSSLLLK